MKIKNIINVICRILLLIISAFLMLGVEFVFPSCNAQEDGTFMSCHWAQQGVLAASMILTFMAIVLLIIQNSKTQLALSVCMTGGAIITALIPNTMIQLCVMPAMHCNAVMKPSVLACCIALAVISIVNLIVNVKTEK